MNILICKVKDEKFYPVEASGEKTLKQEAEDTGKINDHILSIEDIFGNVLWKRENK